MKQYKLASITIAALLSTMSLAVSLAVSLVISVAPAEAQAKKQQTRGAYRAQLDALLSANNEPCKSNDDCEAVGVGAKPCGGPTEFVLISKSTRSKVGSDLDDLTKMITQLDNESNATAGTMGTCEVMKKPDLACNSGSCVKASAPKTEPKN